MIFKVSFQHKPFCNSVISSPTWLGHIPWVTHASGTRLTRLLRRLSSQCNITSFSSYVCHSVQEGFEHLRVCLIHEGNHPGHGNIRECVLQMSPWPAVKQRRVSQFLQRGRFQHCRPSAGTVSPSADCLGTPELSHCSRGLS